ncbi:MAG: protoporphyrinogen oxidase [Candidatus Latescibacterota bacterium]
MQEPKTIRVAVIGAGISGLTTAYWLDKAGYDVTVLEKSSRPGGSIVTERSEGFLIDLGANSTLETSTTLTELIRELGLEDQKRYGSEASNNRYVVKNGLLHAIPTSGGKFLKTKLFSAKAKLRLLLEPFIKPTDGSDISLADFVEYRLGKEFLDYAINPFVAGVYAGDPKTLSTPAAFPKLYALEQNYGSFIKGAIKGAKERKKRNEVSKDRAKLFSFVDGMQILTDTLSEKLQGKIRLESEVTLLQREPSGFGLEVTSKGSTETHQYDQVVLTVPTYTLAKLLHPLAQEKACRIGNTEHPPVTVVFMGFREEDVVRDIDGFGYLIPEVEKKRTLGSIWSSNIFPNRAPEGYVAFTNFVGGTRQPQNARLDDAEIEKLVYEDLNDLVGLRGQPTIVRIKRWQKAIPQYTMGYQEVQQIFSDIEEEIPGLFLAGNYRRGIGVGDSVLSAFETVTKMSA